MSLLAVRSSFVFATGLSLPSAALLMSTLASYISVPLALAVIFFGEFSASLLAFPSLCYLTPQQRASGRLGHQASPVNSVYALHVVILFTVFCFRGVCVCLLPQSVRL
jgi:hypothetical protein